MAFPTATQLFLNVRDAGGISAEAFQMLQNVGSCAVIGNIGAQHPGKSSFCNFMLDPVSCKPVFGGNHPVNQLPNVNISAADHQLRALCQGWGLGNCPSNLDKGLCVMSTDSAGDVRSTLLTLLTSTETFFHVNSQLEISHLEFLYELCQLAERVLKGSNGTRLFGGLRILIWDPDTRAAAAGRDRIFSDQPGDDARNKMRQKVRAAFRPNAITTHVLPASFDGSQLDLNGGLVTPEFKEAVSKVMRQVLLGLFFDARVPCSHITVPLTGWQQATIVANCVQLIFRTTEPPRTSEPTSRRRWSAQEADSMHKQLRNFKQGETSEESTRLMQLIISEAWAMALTRHGCRVVQAALDVAGAADRKALADVFKGKVWCAMKSPHANHVLQRCITVLTPDKVSFIIEELKGRVGEAARHPYGCRVLERLLEHCPCEQTWSLAEEVIFDAPKLSSHPFGNYVVQHVLEHGAPDQRRQLIEAICSSARHMARHKVSSHVIEAALMHCSQEDRARLKKSMASDAEELAALAHSNYGSFVAKEMKKR